MRKNLQFILTGLFLLFTLCSITEIYGQNSCSGTIQANTLGAWGSGATQIGDGTPGNIQVCITSNTIGTNSCMGTSESIVVSTGAGTGVQTLWNAGTATPTCFTFATGTGFGFISTYCWSGGDATLTWETVDGSGNSVCPTCSDGIQNQGETGIDCGGPCPPCAPSCSDGIQNQGETGIDCGGPCPPCGGPSCTDGIQNQDETGIDCGGSICPPCATCTDGIQNQGETGVDCGGPCPITCTENTTPVSSGCGCPAAAAATVYPTYCDQIGTSAYNTNSPTISFESCGAPTAPTMAPTCGTQGGTGTWIQVDLDDTVTQVQLAFDGDAANSVGSGNSNTYVQAYQGTNCSSLSAVGCELAVEFSGGGFGVFQTAFDNLNPNQDLWIYMYNDGNKAFNLDFDLIGTTGPPPNTSCASASTAIGNSCNLGAPGASFATPGACNGGNWGSNENTTFYAFTSSATTADLEINNISCNDGTSGQAQFGVWTDCANVGTGTGFLGCAVGTAPLVLSGLTPGQTYYIAADGFAGDNCVWEFVGANIVILLPIEITDFKAQKNDKSIDLRWSADKIYNIDYYTVERSTDGIEYETVSIVNAASQASSEILYTAKDDNPYSGTSYYRLKETSLDGTTKYSQVVSVFVEAYSDKPVVYPNPVSGNGVIEFNSAVETEQLISIYNVSGGLVYERKYAIRKGNNKLTLEINSLSKGIYFVKLNDGASGSYIKFFKD